MLVEVLQELSFSQFCFKSDLLFAEETLKLIVGNTFRNLLGSKFFSSVGGGSSSCGAELALLEMHSRFFSASFCRRLLMESAQMKSQNYFVSNC